MLFRSVSPANSSFDSDDDDDDNAESTTSLAKPPTLEEIYAAMDSTASPIQPIPLNPIKVPGSLKGTNSVFVPTSPPQQPTTLANQHGPINPKLTTTTMTVPSTPPPSWRQHGSSDTGVVQKGKRSTYISNLYDSPIRTPCSLRRPTNGLRRFEQRMRQPNKQQPGAENIGIDSIAISESTDNCQEKAHFDETLLLDENDVMDVIASTPTTAVVSVETTSSANLSLSESILDSDTEVDDDNACDYTTNSDTSGWASMGDSTAGPLGCSDSIMTDHISIGSIGSDHLTRQRTVLSVSPVNREVMNPLADPSTTTVPLQSKPPTLTKRKNNQGKTKNTVTFQIESIEVNIAKSQMQQKKDTSTPATAVRQILKATSRNTVNQPLFVTARRADELCMTHGGHLSIAIRCGMKVTQSPSEECTKLLPLQTKATSPSLNVRLSTDFRCGTYGSLYDIAMRSGGNDAGIVQDRREGFTPTNTDKSNMKHCTRKTRTRVVRATTTTTTRNTQQSSNPILTTKKKPVNQPVGAGKSKIKQLASSYIPVRGGICDTVLRGTKTDTNLTQTIGATKQGQNDTKIYR